MGVGEREKRQQVSEIKITYVESGRCRDFEKMSAYL
jgi:hypothetical protein